MVLIIKDYSKEGKPLCSVCKKNIGIRAVQNNEYKFVPICNSCYEESTRPVLRSEIKDIIKEAINEYDNKKRNDKA